MPAVIVASSSWLITPDLGLTIWIIVVFGVSLFILSKAVYPRIGQVLDQRAKVINDSIDAAENTRHEADQLLVEYRQRLAEARQQAEEILDRARQAAAVHEREARTSAQDRGEQIIEQARREIDAESRRAIDDILRDVADLTVLATERVTRKSLTDEDQRRLIQDALADLDLSVLGGGADASRDLGRPLVEEVAQVYARALFEVASDRDELDTVKEQLGQFADALSADHNLAIFFYSPYFSTEEKKQGLSRTVEGADETIMNFLETLVERHRMPEIFRIRARFEELWDAEMKLLPVEVTSAVPLDEATIRSIGDRISQETGNKIELTTVVDPDLLGGIVLRVGNSILDASLRSRLNELRKQVAQARIPTPAKEPVNANADQA